VKSTFAPRDDPHSLLLSGEPPIGHELDGRASRGDLPARVDPT
jgi:hypothetical protein